MYYANRTEILNCKSLFYYAAHIGEIFINQRGVNFTVDRLSRSSLEQMELELSSGLEEKVKFIFNSVILLLGLN